MNKDDCKPKIAYPCLWAYKVIGRDSGPLQIAVSEALSGREYSETPSRSSRSGAYLCLNIETTVESEAARLFIYEKLHTHPAVIMVM